MVEPRPTKIPTWNTGGSNRTEPTSGEKVTGWALNDQPPSSYFNWLQYYSGAWVTWISERLLKGTDEEDVTLTALTPATTGEGGDLVLMAGEANGADGGDAFLNGGDADGTNQEGGRCNISTGDSTGTGDSRVTASVAEPGTSGTSKNSPSVYMTMIGANKEVVFNRHLVLNDITSTTKGAGKIASKSQPSGPDDGDFYYDSTSKQLRVYDGSTYRGATRRVYALDNSSTTVLDTTATEKTFQLTGPVDLKYVIPANYIGTGAIIRVLAGFSRLGTPADEPGFNIRLGSYSAITGALLSTITPSAGGATLDNFSIELEVHLRAGGATGAVRAKTTALAEPASLTWQSPVSHLSVRDLTSIVFSGALDLYPTVVWNAVGSGNQWMVCNHFTVDIL